MKERAAGPLSAQDEAILAEQAGAYDSSGVDLTLVDWMLSLSPRERLEALFVHGESIARLLDDARTD